MGTGWPFCHEQKSEAPRQEEMGWERKLGGTRDGVHQVHGYAQGEWCSSCSKCFITGPQWKFSIAKSLFNKYIFVNIKLNSPKVSLFIFCFFTWMQLCTISSIGIFRGWEWISSLLFPGKSVKSHIFLVLLTRKIKLHEVMGRRGLPMMNL